MARGKHWSKTGPVPIPSSLYYYRVSHNILGETLLGPYNRRVTPSNHYTLIETYEYKLNKEGNYILKVV